MVSTAEGVIVCVFISGALFSLGYEHYEACAKRWGRNCLSWPLSLVQGSHATYKLRPCSLSVHLPWTTCHFCGGDK